MTEAAVDRWRARGREGETARAREEWSIISAKRGEEKKRGASFTIELQEEREDSHAPRTSKSSETIPTPLKHGKVNQKTHQRAKNHSCSCLIADSVV